MYSKADLHYIRELKQTEPFSGFRERTADGEACRIKILGRGELAFHQQGDRALLLEVLAGRGVIFARSIRRWDDGKKVTEEEREIVVELMTRVMHQLGHEQVAVVRS